MTSEQALSFIGIVATATLAGIAGAMGWFRSQRLKIETDVNTLRAEMRSQMDDHHDNDRDIAVLKIEIRNNVERLEEINESTKETNRKLDQLSSTLTNVLMAVNRK